MNPFVNLASASHTFMFEERTNATWVVYAHFSKIKIILLWYALSPDLSQVQHNMGTTSNSHPLASDRTANHGVVLPTIFLGVHTC